MTKIATTPTETPVSCPKIPPSARVSVPIRLAGGSGACPNSPGIVLTEAAEQRRPPLNDGQRPADRRDARASSTASSRTPPTAYWNPLSTKPYWSVSRSAFSAIQMAAAIPAIARTTPKADTQRAARWSVNKKIHGRDQRHAAAWPPGWAQARKISPRWKATSRDAADSMTATPCLMAPDSSRSLARRPRPLPGNSAPHPDEDPRAPQPAPARHRPTTGPSQPSLRAVSRVPWSAHRQYHRPWRWS